MAARQAPADGEVVARTVRPARSTWFTVAIQAALVTTFGVQTATDGRTGWRLVALVLWAVALVLTVVPLVVDVRRTLVLTDGELRLDRRFGPPRRRVPRAAVAAVDGYAGAGLPPSATVALTVRGTGRPRVVRLRLLDAPVPAVVDRLRAWAGAAAVPPAAVAEMTPGP